MLRRDGPTGVQFPLAVYRRLALEQLITTIVLTLFGIGMYLFGRFHGHDYTKFLLRRNRELAEENERLKADDWQVFDVED